MAQLIQTADLLTFLRSNAAPGSLLYNQTEILRRGLERAVVRYCKWPIAANDGLGQGNYNEYADGTGSKDIILRRPWVAKATSVRLDMAGAYGGGNNAFAAATVLTEGSDWELVFEQPGRCQSGLLRRLTNTTQVFPSDFVYPRDAGGLSHRRGAYWPRGFGNVKVTYDWGFQTQDMPSSVINAISTAANVVTVTLAAAAVLRPGDEVTLVGTGSSDGDYQVATMAANNLSFTVNSAVAVNYSGSGGKIDCVPWDIKTTIASAVGMWRERVRLGVVVTGENLGDYSYSAQLLKELGAYELLKAWRDWSVGINL